MANLDPQDNWNSTVLSRHPLFWPLRPGASAFVESFENWPTLRDYQNFLNNSDAPVKTASSLPLRVVEQAAQPTSFEYGYEPRIYLKGELQTRKCSWHDFFQILVWKVFPQTKARLNEMHYQAIKARKQLSQHADKRSVLENALTQYDECGAVLISPSRDVLDLVQQFDWRTLFWKRRENISDHLKCIVFGHAIYEKGINPYTGMTAHCVLLHIPTDTFNLPTKELLPCIDTLVADQFFNNHIQTPQDLSPFPLLGIPGWHPENSQENYYRNSNYFRPGRKLKT